MVVGKNRHIDVGDLWVQEKVRQGTVALDMMEGLKSPIRHPDEADQPRASYGDYGVDAVPVIDVKGALRFERWEDGRRQDWHAR